jgi:hypothetical protein
LIPSGFRCSLKPELDICIEKAMHQMLKNKPTVIIFYKDTKKDPNNSRALAITIEFSSSLSPKHTFEPSVPAFFVGLPNHYAQALAH